MVICGGGGGNWLKLDTPPLAVPTLIEFVTIDCETHLKKELIDNGDVSSS